MNRPEPRSSTFTQKQRARKSPTEKESSPKEVVNISFKGGTEEAKNLAVVFDLKNGQKLDGQRIPPVRVDEHNPTLGPDDAPVTWVIFGGWECPFSNRLPPVIKALHKAYPERLRIVFKHVTPSHKKVGTIAARESRDVGERNILERGNGTPGERSSNGDHPC